MSNMGGLRVDVESLAACLDRLEGFEWPLCKRMQDRLNAEAVAAYRRRFPRRKASIELVRKNAPDLIEAGMARWKPRFERALRALKKRKARVDRALDWIAKRQDAPAAIEPLVYASIDRASYRSQGFGQERYARVAADQDAAHCMMLGVRAEVVPWLVDMGPDRNPYDMGFRVLAYTTRGGLEILRRKPVSLKAWLQDCWNRGVNPRVYNPFLPDGLEERLKVSFFPVAPA